MARRGDKGLGNTANGGTAGSYTTIERKENATALQSMRSRITNTFTGSTRYPAYENGEISEELDVHMVHDTPAGRTILLGNDAAGTLSAEYRHEGVKEPLVMTGDDMSLDTKVTWLKRSAVAAEACHDRFNKADGMEVLDVDLTTPRDARRGADFIVKVGTPAFDLTFAHDYGRQTSTLSAWNYQSGPMPLSANDEKLLLSSITGRPVKNFQEDMKTLFAEMADEISIDPDADEHLKDTLYPGVDR